MSDRQRRVEEVLRREMAGLIVAGELRDPRLSSPAICITGVAVSPDLSSARVYVDVLGSELSIDKVLSALNAARSAARARLSKRIRMKRVPSLSFMRDESITKGAAIERVLLELADERRDREGDAAGEGDTSETVESPSTQDASEDG